MVLTVHIGERRHLSVAKWALRINAEKLIFMQCRHRRYNYKKRLISVKSLVSFSQSNVYFL